MNYTPPKDFDIVKQWGPWTLTKDGCLHNADISEYAKEDWYLELDEIKTREDLVKFFAFFATDLIYASDQRHGYSLLKKIFEEIYGCRISLLGCTFPFSKNAKANLFKFMQQNSRSKRIKLQPSLRFKILHRDQHRCQTCGASAVGGAELHIDHILPVSKGGTNDESNLRVLCSECNIGRGNRYDT